MRTLVLLVLIALIAGCSNPTEPAGTETFNLGSGGYRGEPVGDCDQEAADEICRERGYMWAIDWTCGTEHVSGGFWGDWNQDVMYCVTCWGLQHDQ